MRIERYEFEGFGGVRLPAVLWLPDGAPKCVLQITHGMTEHMGRYARFGEDLCQYGIAVAGFDLRGHGIIPLEPISGNRVFAGRLFCFQDIVFIWGNTGCGVD